MTDKLIQSRLQLELGLDNCQMTPVSGGDINDSYCLSDCDQIYFVKINTNSNHQLILESEAEALRLFKQKNIPSPELISSLHEEQFSYLVLEWIQNHKLWNSHSMHNFAEALSNLHAHHHDQYGYSKNNCIGSLKQHNAWYDNFEDYYWLSRLEPQFKIAINQGYDFSTHELSKIQKILSEIPIDKPSLIHGDLWAGNYLQDAHNHIYFIDPSISYGHPITDLAMMQLFGGFPKSVFQFYFELNPQWNNYEEYVPLFQLYYLLVHLNLFGSSYYPQVKLTIRKYL